MKKYFLRKVLQSSVFAMTSFVIFNMGVVSASSAEPSSAYVSEKVVANALVGTNFNPGMIISDEDFYDANRMNQTDIQNFLNSKVARCAEGHTCLKDYRTQTFTRPANPMCFAYNSSGVESSAMIIDKVSKACGINPQVLLILLEKEQSLVTMTNPTQTRFDFATGFNCPDDGSCVQETKGFYNQVYKAAWQFKRYLNPPGTDQYFTWIRVGAYNDIRYHPNASCGASRVFIANKATASLYYYTPYQPNQAALNNLYGTGNSCSSYGNRNFWRLGADWFGIGIQGSPAKGVLDAANVNNTTFQVAGWAFDPLNHSQSVSVRVTYTTPKNTMVHNIVANQSRPDVGRVFSIGNHHGFSHSIPLEGPGQYQACVQIFPTTNQNVRPPLSLGCDGRLVLPNQQEMPTDRVAGQDRFETATAISVRNFSPSTSEVFIASGENYPDSLTAGAAAGARKAPLLLTKKGSLPQTTVKELQRLQPAQVYVIGGSEAISDQTFGAIKSIVPASNRYAGADRFATSRIVANTFFQSPGKALVASGFAFPDALAATATAGNSSMPLVLVDPRTQGFDADTQTLLSNKAITQVYLIGGTTVLSESFNHLGGANVHRLGGVDRFETALRATEAFAHGTQSLYLAQGFDFPDALAGGPGTAFTTSPLMIIPQHCVPRSIADYIVQQNFQKVVFLGGEKALLRSAQNFAPC